MNRAEKPAIPTPDYDYVPSTATRDELNRLAQDIVAFARNMRNLTADQLETAIHLVDMYRDTLKYRPDFACLDFSGTALRGRLLRRLEKLDR